MHKSECQCGPYTEQRAKFCLWIYFGFLLLVFCISQSTEFTWLTRLQILGNFIILNHSLHGNTLAIHLKCSGTGSPVQNSMQPVPRRWQRRRHAPQPRRAMNYRRHRANVLHLLWPSTLTLPMPLGSDFFSCVSMGGFVCRDGFSVHCSVSSCFHSHYHTTTRSLQSSIRNPTLPGINREQGCSI